MLIHIFIKKIAFFILLGLGSLLVMSCATTNPPPMGNHPAVPETNTEIGVRYLLGRGVAEDNEKAFYYFSKAANNGDPFAENEVAYLYATGKGTPQDVNKAFIYYERAAKHNLASAQYNLGLFYLHGLGTEKNKELGIEWITKSADHGFLPAKRALAAGIN